MNKKLAAGLVIVLTLVGAAGYKLFRPVEKGITATGTIEVTRADVMPKVSGYISNFTLKAGDRVEVGQMIAKINRADLEAQVLRDEAALNKAQVQLRDLEAGARSQERQELAAAMQSAQSVYDKARTDFSRYQKLYEQGAVSTQQLDAARSVMEVAYNSLTAARQRLSLTEEGNRPDVMEAQRLEIERSRAVLAASRVAVEDTVITSPISGLVMSKNYENGEYMNPGSALITVGDMSDCWVKVYISSTQLGLLQVGQPAKVKVDSFPDRTFTGEIKEISHTAEFTPRQSITQSERANLVFAVKVKLDNSEGVLKPGMPADVIIK